VEDTSSFLMTAVPCSSSGRRAEGTRWVLLGVSPMHSFFAGFVRRDELEVSRFVCDEHARTFVQKGWVAQPPLDDHPRV